MKVECHLEDELKISARRWPGSFFVQIQRIDLLRQIVQSPHEKQTPTGSCGAQRPALRHLWAPSGGGVGLGERNQGRPGARTHLFGGAAQMVRRGQAAGHPAGFGAGFGGCGLNLWTLRHSMPLNQKIRRFLYGAFEALLVVVGMWGVLTFR